MWRNLCAALVCVLFAGLAGVNDVSAAFLNIAEDDTRLFDDPGGTCLLQQGKAVAAAGQLAKAWRLPAPSAEQASSSELDDLLLEAASRRDEALDSSQSTTGLGAATDDVLEAAALRAQSPRDAHALRVGSMALKEGARKEAAAEWENERLLNQVKQAHWQNSQLRDADSALLRQDDSMRKQDE
ncbi:unnamed protein product, partial [Polarella glacialis]